VSAATLPGLIDTLVAARHAGGCCAALRVPMKAALAVPMWGR
jgi:hypothetical protein